MFLIFFVQSLTYNTITYTTNLITCAINHITYAMKLFFDHLLPNFVRQCCLIIYAWS